ncbi:hypothetical protein [Spongorhabdus nitratireducens]
MPEQYSVILNGQLCDGVSLQQASQRLQKLFKATAKKVESMLSGQPVVLKHNLDKQTAEKYKTALLKAGVMSKIQFQRPRAKSAVKDITKSSNQGHSPSTQQPTPDWEVMPPGTSIGEPKPAHFIEPDTGHLDISPQQGYIVEQNQTPAPPPPDTSHLALEPR